ncbi:hypothetical protein Dsin_003881 [Dipteronia sinensis]|uniref:Uncharacterized protein n=1 Tax=Dipteronia sinensis TaxID=43782 RepID=A0AAE0EMJ8_9ROSI|nr:hypothetical protein Dsin_003881 [Dipteronia sinensis]
MFFDDSVPSTPLARFGNSPTRFSEVSTDHFDSFSRFDSFNMHDAGFSSQPERLTRFDSIYSTKDFGFGGPERLTSVNVAASPQSPDILFEELTLEAGHLFAGEKLRHRINILDLYTLSMTQSLSFSFQTNKDSNFE